MIKNYFYFTNTVHRTNNDFREFLHIHKTMLNFSENHNYVTQLIIFNQNFIDEILINNDFVQVILGRKKKALLANKCSLDIL